jgi:DNA-directed RNA polymerase specialized sigma24 family protein
MAIQQEHRQIAARVLSEMPQRDREVLVRFYVNEETPAQIQREMVLSSNQFRLLKSRAKARFSKAVQASLPAQSPAV